MIIQSVVCDVRAQFLSLPANIVPTSANTYIKVIVATQADDTGLPVGAVVQHFLQKGLGKYSDLYLVSVLRLIGSN